MYTIILIFHVIICILLVLTVLIQQGKGAEIGAVFGSSDTLFGSSGPISLIGKITTGLAIFFMLTSLSLTYLSAHKGTGSIMEGVKVTAPQQKPDIEKAISEPMPSKAQGQAETPALPENKELK